MIKIVNLHKTFGETEVLKGISLDISQNQVTVIMGPSGSGKSTLLRCINGLEEISSGTVVVDGHDVRSKKTDINFIRTEVGMVFQQFNLFPHMTVLENVTLGPRKIRKMPRPEAEKLGQNLLKKVGLQTNPAPILIILAAGRSSGWPLPALLPCVPRPYFLTNPPAHLILSFLERCLKS